MEEAAAAAASQYWCHMCSQMVNPVMETDTDTVNCPICQSGFVEEMPSRPVPINRTPLDLVLGGSDTDSDRALSLWAPILLGMMSNPRRRRRSRRAEFEEDADNNSEDDNNNNNNGNNSSNNNNNVTNLEIQQSHPDRETELDRELESIIRRRRRSSAAILQLLQGIRAGILSESGNLETRDRDNNRERERERVILINPFNQTIIVQGGGAFDNPTVGGNDSQNRTAPIGSLGDYFIGPGLDLLLQHLSENDPNRYGTPPAQKEAVEALPTVKVEGTPLQCYICLDECEADSEVKEMPCKHKFHSGCILPWLELHSTCPTCRYQLPCDESKLEAGSEGSRNSNTNNIINDRINDGGGGVNNDNARQYMVPLLWPFSSLFLSSSTPGSRPPMPPASSEPSTNANENANAVPPEDGPD